MTTTSRFWLTAFALISLTTELPAQTAPIRSGDGWAIHAQREPGDWAKLVAQGNLVAGKLVQPQPLPNDHNTGSELKHLTDGVLAGAEGRMWSDKRAMGWAYMPFTRLRFDLGEARALGQIVLRMQVINKDNTLPSLIKVSLSDDGDNYSPVRELAVVGEPPALAAGNKRDGSDGTPDSNEKPDARAFGSLKRAKYEALPFDPPGIYAVALDVGYQARFVQLDFALRGALVMDEVAIVPAAENVTLKKIPPPVVATEYRDYVFDRHDQFRKMIAPGNLLAGKRLKYAPAPTQYLNIDDDDPKQLLRRLVVVLSCLIVADVGVAAEPPLTLATFRVDVTPSIGDGPCVGCMSKVSSIGHPLELRGIVLRADSRTFVIAAIDYCGLCDSSDETIRDAMARAAGTTRERVALQSLHQHSAPILDAEAVRFLHGEKSEQLAQRLKFTDDIASRTAEAITASLTKMQAVTRIVGSKAMVDRVASNHRVPQPDGSIAVRASFTREVAVREAPEGLIDPWLRTLTFFDGEQRLVQLHYYATHPQTLYGDARVSWDSVGMARERFEKESLTFQIYFTGCGGNVTVGKYNDGTRDAREQLATRLLEAMRRSSNADRVNEVDVAQLKSDDIDLATAPIKFTVREDGAFNPALLRKQLAPDQSFSTRLTAAMFSGFGKRLRDGYVAQATRLRIGDIDVVHLPGEPFVEFQLFAQDVARAKSFTCVAGYGECGVWYYGPDHIFTDRGGYEQTWSLTGPCGQSVKAALRRLLEK